MNYVNMSSRVSVYVCCWLQFKASLNCSIRLQTMLTLLLATHRVTPSFLPHFPCLFLPCIRRSPHMSAVHWQHDAGSEDVPVAVHRVQVLQHLRHLRERRMYTVGEGRLVWSKNVSAQMLLLDFPLNWFEAHWIWLVFRLMLWPFHSQYSACHRQYITLNSTYFTCQADVRLDKSPLIFFFTSVGKVFYMWKIHCSFG